MPKVRLNRPLLILFGALLLPETPLFAEGSGGAGGGGMAPSMSARDFDSAAEYRAGVEALKASKFENAKKSFDRLLSMSPRDANTNYLAGLAATGLNDLKGARKYYERAVKANGGMILARRQLGITYAKLSERAKAAAEVAALNALQAKCGQSCPDAAGIAAGIAAIGAALQAGPTARLETAPDRSFANVEAGDKAYLDAVELINERRYEAAIASLQAASTAFGQHPDILTYLGFSNRKLGRFEIAEAYYRQALIVAPKHRGATEYFGELMVERGDMKGARTMLAKLETLCDFGCAEADELRLWIDKGRSPAS